MTRTRAQKGDPVKTDYSRWRLISSKDGGRHVWHYLKTEKEAKEWPQSDEDRFHLGLGVEAPELPKAKTAIESATNAFEFYKRIQSADGHWAGEYGGPMFLIPGLIIGMRVTHTPVPEEWSIEIRRYLLNRQNSDGGWGLHTSGPSTVFGTALNYAVCRLLGMDADHPEIIRARAKLHELGGATGVPSWGKFWLAVLGAYDWEGMNPIPPELWCLPDWIPLHPWRWWIHTRQVYVPMGFLWGKRFHGEIDGLVLSLREELYVQPYDEIKWKSCRNNIASVDVYAPHTKTMEALFNVIAVYDNCGGIPPLRRAGIRRAYDLICMEDDNTGYQGIGPVNKMMNYVSRWIEEGSDSEAMKIHREKLKDFLWINEEGLMMTGTNGSQSWDLSFAAQGLVLSGLAKKPEHRESCEKILEWLDHCQIRENPKHYESAYRFATKGAWPFSTKEQGYTVSDTTGEGLKAVIMLQYEAGLPKRIGIERLRDTVDLLLTMQNRSGGFASYETINAPAFTEWLNPAEVFGDIMIEYDYPECTTSVITALLKFKQIDNYREKDIDRCVDRAIKYLLKIQRPDGSWYGCWAVCFTYACFFALESLSLAGMTYETSDSSKRACDFLASIQMEDGGWGEAFECCTEQRYIPSPNGSQIIQTAWAIIGLMHARYPNKEVIERGVKLIMSRQKPDGHWVKEDLVGVFNRSTGIEYPNYTWIFPLKALGLFAERY